MTFEKLAKMVANSFKETMLDEGFETFKEMRDCYCMSSEDVKDEIDSIIRYIANDTHADAWLSDDGSFVQVEGDDISYRKFNAMVMTAIRK